MFFPQQINHPAENTAGYRLMKNQFDHYRKTGDVRSQKKKAYFS